MILPGSEQTCSVTYGFDPKWRNELTLEQRNIKIIGFVDVFRRQKNNIVSNEEIEKVKEIAKTCENNAFLNATSVKNYEDILVYDIYNLTNENYSIN